MTDALLATPPSKKAPRSVGSKADKAIVERLQGFLRESAASDARWRERSLKSMRFYFGDQWDANAKADVEDRDQAAIVINDVKAAVRTVMGLMLGQPFDWIGRPIGMDDDALADLVTGALKHIADANLSMDVYKNVYFWLLTYGVSWAHAGLYVRNHDPRREPVQFRWVDSREVRLDPHSRQPDLCDARYLIWSRRMLLSEATARWKPRADALEQQAGGSDDNLDDAATGNNRNQGLIDVTPPQSMWDRLEDWNYVEKDVTGGAVPMVIVHETWEVIREKAWLLEGKDGVPIEIPLPMGRIKTVEELKATVQRLADEMSPHFPAVAPATVPGVPPIPIPAPAGGTGAPGNMPVPQANQSGPENDTPTGATDTQPDSQSDAPNGGAEPEPVGDEERAVIAWLHQQANGPRGVRKIYQHDVPHVYRRIHCGPMLLESEREDCDRIPWVGCWYERDEHGDPVSFIEALKDLGRDQNYRASRALFELSGQPMRVNPKVAARMNMTAAEIAEHGANPGAVWLAESGEVEYLNRPDTATRQMEIGSLRSQQIKSTSGANDDLQGAPSQSRSGVSKSITLQQGQTMQRDSESSLRLFHKQLGELCLWYIQAEHTDEWTFRVVDEQGASQIMTANQQQPQPDGSLKVLNSLTATSFEVVIDSQPWTPTLREQASTMYATMAQSEQDPIRRAALQKAQIMAADIPGKSKILQMLDQAAQASAAAAQQQPRKDLRDILQAAPLVIPPQYVGSALAELGLQAGPLVAGATTGSPSEQQAPPLDQNKLMAEHTKIINHQAQLAHDASEADKQRQHEATLAGLKAGAGASQQGAQRAHELELGTQAHAARVIQGAHQMVGSMVKNAHARTITPPPSQPMIIPGSQGIDGP